MVIIKFIKIIQEICKLTDIDNYRSNCTDAIDGVAPDPHREIRIRTDHIELIRGKFRQDSVACQKYRHVAQSYHGCPQHSRISAEAPGQRVHGKQQRHRHFHDKDHTVRFTEVFPSQPQCSCRCQTEYNSPQFQSHMYDCCH